MNVGGVVELNVSNKSALTSEKWGIFTPSNGGTTQCHNSVSLPG